MSTSKGIPKYFHAASFAIDVLIKPVLISLSSLYLHRHFAWFPELTLVESLVAILFFRSLLTSYPMNVWVRGIEKEDANVEVLAERPDL